ncbi:MAG TPA: SMP-30/gluconolactonase/LRE family protein [Caulobacterales bacterium]|nr:SMP-30/gluconolactonase/LRE family protein [Caulobacterales bacterium]
MKTKGEPRCVWPVRAVLGEGPVWVAAENALYFVDIKAPALHRYALADGATKTWPMPEPIGWVIPRAAKSGFIAGLKSGFYELTLDPFELKPIGSPETHLPDNRRNDAKVDKWGRIWAGSMEDPVRRPNGQLFRLDPDFSWRVMDGGYKVCNGPTFSLDHAVMYHTDSGAKTIYAFDLSPDGAIANKRVFVKFEPDWGSPDGMTTDAEGCLWVAHWDGGRISRFTPDGELDRSILLPASRITSCAFAGEDLDRLFITSASEGRENEELAGGLFELRPGVRGAPQYAFAG